jgi:hypothetical protein
LAQPTIHKMKKKYALVLISIILIISFFDWYEHTHRKNSLFEAYPLKWLMYTYASCILLIIATIVFNLLLKNLIKHNYIKEIVALFLGFLTFQLSGNYIRQITVPEIPLHFNFNLLPILIILLLYSVFYFIFYYFFERKHK